MGVNLTLAQDPLYELAQWVDSLDLRALDYDPRLAERFSDNRFARALDQLYETDRTSLLTRLVVSAIQAFDIRSERIHNDSTSVKACGRIPGRTRTGLELRRGHSKDHVHRSRRPPGTSSPRNAIKTVIRGLYVCGLIVAVAGRSGHRRGAPQIVRGDQGCA